MNVLTVWEGDGQTTRIKIPVDAIAHDMARYFREEIKLVTMLEMDTDETVTHDDDEAERAKLYVNEWRNFGGLSLSIVH